MLTLNLPADLDSALAEASELTGRSKEQLVEKAIRRQIEDLEDVHVAEARLADIEAGRSRTIPLSEIMKGHGLEN